MMKFKKLFIGIILAVQSLCLLAGVGDSAQDFTVTTLSGESYTLSDDYGKVILIFFFGHNCPYCAAHGPKIQRDIVDVYSSNPDFAAVGLGVWDGSNAQVEAFKTSTGLTIPLGVQASAVGSLYGVAHDVLVVIDSRQTIIFESQSYQDASDAAKTKIQEALDELSGSVTSAVSFEQEMVKLEQNFPNPFVTSTTIPYSLEVSSEVRLSIFDITGREEKVLVNEYQPAGNYEIALSDSQLANGIYFYRLETGKETLYRRMVKQ